VFGAALLAVVPFLERWAEADFAMPVVARVAGAAFAAALIYFANDLTFVVIGGCPPAVFVLFSLPQTGFSLSTPGWMIGVVAVGVALQIVCAALLGQLSSSDAASGHADAGAGLRIAALWLMALWAYPLAVSAVLARSGVRVGVPEAVSKPATG